MEITKKTVARIIGKYGIYIAFLLLFIFLSIASPVFLTGTNIINILRQVSVKGIISIGMTYVIITGGIDLSVGAIVALSGVITTSMVREGSTMPLWIAILIGLIVGVACGAFSGFFASKMNVAPFIGTLATCTIARGLTYVYTNGQPVTGLTPEFTNIGSGFMGFLPIPVICFMLFIIIGGFFLHFTKFGRYIFAIGGNEKAAIISGIKSNKIKLSCYVVSGLCAAAAGIVLAARIRTGQPASGNGYELDAITAFVIGGGSLSGGIGSIVGTILGMLVLGVLTNGLDLLNVSSYYQQVIKGVIILVAVLADRKKQIG